MSLDDCYQENQGKIVSFDGNPENAGQCLQWVSIVNRDVYNAPAFYTPGAKDWWNNFEGSPIEPYYDKISDGSVQKGDIVVFNTQVGSQYGHIDVAMQDGSTSSFQGADSNWGGNLTVHLVQHNNSNYILGSLRPKGAPVQTPIDLIRIVASEIEGYDNYDNIHSGKDDAALLAAWGGQPIDNYIRYAFGLKIDKRTDLERKITALEQKQDYTPVTKQLYEKK